MAVPVLQSLVLADHVYTDARTNNKIIAGTFNAIASPTFPAVFGSQTWAYMCLTNIRKKIEIRLRYIDLNDNKVLMESSPISVTADGPLESVEVIMAVPPLPMPHPGTYTFEVHCENERLGSLRVSALEIKQDERSTDN